MLSFFIITGILFVNGVFNGKQPVAVLDSLHCRLDVVILFSFGNGVDKVPADMHPTRAAPDPRQIVVFLISIRFQVCVVAFRELPYMAAAPGWRTAIQDERWKSVLAAEQLHE